MTELRFETIGRRIATGIMAVTLLGIGLPASAAPLQTFFGIDQGSGNPPTTPVNSLAALDAFSAVFTSTGVENFDSLALGVFPSSVSFPSTSITASSSTTDSSNNFVTNGDSFGTFPTSGTQYLYDNGDASGVNDTFTFSSPVAGVGMYITDLSDGVSPPDQIELVLTFLGGTTQTVETSVGGSNNNANLIFFGVAGTVSSQQITSVQILNTQTGQGDAIGIDDLTIGTSLISSTPEPGSFLLLGAGFVGLLFVRRYRLSAKLGRL
jgi:hypothetical protein